MDKATLLCLLLLLARPLALGAVEITSLQPEAAQPGAAVILTVSSAPEQLDLRIGSLPVASSQLAPGIFQFEVPDLPAGDYAVEAGTAEPGQSSPPVRFRILAAPPVIGSIAPATFSFCRGGGPEELEVIGSGFADTAVVLLNGSRIPVTSRSPGRLSLRLPPLPAGLHKIQVSNPDGQSSVPVTLSVVRQPVIHQIESSGNAITSYQLTITGENFSPQSQLLLNGAPLPLRRSDIQTGDRVSYLDCTTLVYQRHPLAAQPQDLEFRVVNPDGQVSNSYTLSGY